MTSPRDKDNKAPREEFEVACSNKVLGRKLQRKTLQRQFDDFSDGHISAVHHGEDFPAPETHGSPPKEDRAG